MDKNDFSVITLYQTRLEKATSYGDVWEIVKDTVRFSLHKRRNSMMLFLDDLPLQLGAYHSIGTNNIVLNRALIRIVEATVESKPVVNAFIYNLLLHEYLHALGEYSEVEVRRMVYEVAKQCFGEDHVSSVIAKKSPWVLLKDVPLTAVSLPRHVMEIVRNFERTDKYVV